MPPPPQVDPAIERFEKSDAFKCAVAALIEG
jgi:hypothetical protein